MQNWLSSWARWWNIPTTRADAPPCIHIKSTFRKQLEKEEVRRFIEAQEAFEKLEREKIQRENARIEVFIEQKAEWQSEVEVAAKERR